MNFRPQRAAGIRETPGAPGNSEALGAGERVRWAARIEAFRARSRSAYGKELVAGRIETEYRFVADKAEGYARRSVRQRAGGWGTAAQHCSGNETRTVVAFVALAGCLADRRSFVGIGREVEGGANKCPGIVRFKIKALGARALANSQNRQSHGKPRH